MLANAFKSFNSNISSNYQFSSHPTFTCGPWKIHTGKKKSTGVAASVFIFEKKALENAVGASAAFGTTSRSSSAALKKLRDVAIERLKREASALARLRHPSILQMLEPVEETRNGGLIFVTELVSFSLAGLLHEKDVQENSGRSSRFMVEASDGTRSRRELEVDEIEIQKGLLQVAKGLEFLHDHAGLVHGNLGPHAIFVNAQSDWKISGLGFSSPIDNNNTTNSSSSTSWPSLALSEVLYHEPRLPASVQLDLDYCSPDFVMDSNITSFADMFSLGILIIALFNSPHRSPLRTHQNAATYKKLLASESTTPRIENNFLSSQPIPRVLTADALPRLITRRAAQRMNAKEFQQSQYFDNVLVSTLQFLEDFPAKTLSEKSQFLRGLPRVLSEFPSSVLHKKLLPALFNEAMDKDLLVHILNNVFKILKILPSSPRAVPDLVIPRLKEIFPVQGVAKATASEHTSGKDVALTVVLDNIQLLADNCSGRIFKDDVIPLVRSGLESQSHALTDAALKCLPAIIHTLDFTTIRDDVFPPIASVFLRTNSLAIKTHALECFVSLCGGGNPRDEPADGLSGVPDSTRYARSHSTPASILDKYTVQGKLVPLLKGIKTKEPAVMVATLKVFRQVGKIADYDFVALEVLPSLWSYALGPLLNVQQFTQFMDLIKELSTTIEREQLKKLQALSLSDDSVGSGNRDTFDGFTRPLAANGARDSDSKTDFERLVLGRSKAESAEEHDAVRTPSPQISGPRDNAPRFSWSSSAPSRSTSSHVNRLASQPAPAPAPPFAATTTTATVTPDAKLTSFPSLTPAPPQSSPTPTSSRPLQPAPMDGLFAPLQPQTHTASQPPSSLTSSSSSSASIPASTQQNQMQQSSSLWTPSDNLSNVSPLKNQNIIPLSTTNSIMAAPPPPPPPPQPGRPSMSLSSSSSFSSTLTPPLRPPPPPAPSATSRPPATGIGSAQSLNQRLSFAQSQPQFQQSQSQSQPQQSQKQGLDKYESLL